MHGIQKVKLSSHISVQTSTLQNKKGVADAECKSLLARIQHEICGQQVEEIVKDVVETHKLTDSQWTIAIEKYKAQEEKVATLASPADLRDMSASLTSICKCKEMEGAVKQWASKKATMTKMMDSLKRKSVVAATPVDDGRRAPPLHVICHALTAELAAPTVPSVFEAKAGMAGVYAKVKQDKADPVDAILGLPFMTRLQKTMQDALKANDSCLLNATEPPKKRKMLNALTEALDPALFHRLAVPKGCSWEEQMFGLQSFASSPQQISVCFTHFAAMEARLLLEGEEVILAMPIDTVPGESLKEKRKYIFQAPNEAVKTLVDNGGFMLKHSSTHPVVLPSGFSYAIASSGCVGIRWTSSADDNDTRRFRTGLGLMLESFPELRNPNLGMSVCHGFLSSSDF